MSLKSQRVPCGELIKGGDEDNPPSEQQLWLTIAKHLFHTTTIFFLLCSCGDGKHWSTFFTLNVKALLKFSDALSAKENVAMQPYMQCENWLANIPALMSICQHGT